MLAMQGVLCVFLCVCLGKNPGPWNNFPLTTEEADGFVVFPLLLRNPGASFPSLTPFQDLQNRGRETLPGGSPSFEPAAASTLQRQGWHLGKTETAAGMQLQRTTKCGSG